ncbi:OmpA family protein [Granulosicoccus sp. 3-233]|uniref:OmpA family protein n=1 Tax=Granulosicoccus sp. 3-233 TaxID=3417969 RepID=UPI003D357DC3
MPQTDSEQMVESAASITMSGRVGARPVARSFGLRVVFAAWLLIIGSQLAHAACSEESLLISRDLAGKAAASDNDTVRLLLLKRSVDECSTYPVWLELGQLQMQLENPFDAVYAFEHAVDFQPGAGNAVTPDQLLRRAIGNARLGEAYRASGELAMALVATEEAVAAFTALDLPIPRRLVQLQARIDDAISQTDADVMVRSIEIQQDRASRGIGVNPRLLEPVESAGTVGQTLALLSDYSGDPVMSPNDLSVEFFRSAEALVGEEPSTQQLQAIGKVEQEPREARLNIPVLFKFDSAELSDESHATIEQLAAALVRLELDRDDTVLVIGHTDSRGSATYNMNLSRARAEVVADVLAGLLKAESASTAELQFQGRGETELRYSGDQAEDHRRNRRVEVIVRQQS